MVDVMGATRTLLEQTAAHAADYLDRVDARPIATTSTLAQLRKKLSLNPQYKKTRYLDPANTAGSRKDFYNPNIVGEFDKAYTRKK